jgi:hypothetical protein
MRLVKLFALATLTAVAAGAAQAATGGPELEPKFNFNAVLRPDAGAKKKESGLIKFRQPVDDKVIVYLDVTLRRMARNHSYYVERGADPVVDGNCAPDAETAMWARLGQGPVPDAVNIDRKGNGRALLFRELPPTAVGVTFDLHFRVVDAITGAIVLRSRCFQYTARR